MKIQHETGSLFEGSNFIMMVRCVDGNAGQLGEWRLPGQDGSGNHAAERTRITDSFGEDW